MMNVIIRNLVRLIRAGAFETDEKIEPLSLWKWQCLFKMAQIHGVTSYVMRGMDRLHQHVDIWIEPKENDGVGLSEEELDLASPLLKKELKLIEEEVLESNDKTLTLNLLRILIGTTAGTISMTLSVRQLVELGIFLRTDGNNVDYVKLESWTKRLSMQRVTQLTGQLLVRLFLFEISEVPFMRPYKDNKETDAIINDIFSRSQNSSAPQLTFNEGKIFVTPSGSTAMLQNMRHSARYFRYLPSESVARFCSSILRSLRNIEE